MDWAAAVGVGASAAGVFGALVVGARWVQSHYRKTFGSRGAERALLQQLACGMTSERVHELLGSPVFRRHLEDAAGALEYVYRLRHSWVQLIVDGASEVARIAITATDPKLLLPMDKISLGQLKGQLGEGTFLSLSSSMPPAGVWLSLGARRFWYAEAYSFGNPGGYQTYILAYNDVSGVGEADPAALMGASALGHSSGRLVSLEQGVCDPFPLDVEPALTFRGRGRPNTLVVLKQDRDYLVDKPPFGPDMDHVRVLPD